MIWKTKHPHLSIYPRLRSWIQMIQKETLSRLRIIKTSPKRVKGIAPSYIEPSSEKPLSIHLVHYYGWFPKWTQMKPIYQSTEFIRLSMNDFHSEPNWKTMYQSIEFIPMNYFNSELKWKPCISLLNSYLWITSIVNPKENPLSVYWVHNYEWL